MNPHLCTGSPVRDFLSTDIDGFDSLTELALDMRWSWNHSTDEIWRQLDPVLWELTHHPWDVLQTVSREKVKEVLSNPDFRKKIDTFVQSKKQEEKARCMVSAKLFASSLDLRCILQYGIHVERSTPDLFRWTW